MPEGKEIYGIEAQIYRPNNDGSAWTRVKNVGVITPTDEKIESDLSTRDGVIELAGGIRRRVSYEFELLQRASSPDRTFFYNAYKNNTTIELAFCDTAMAGADMLGIRGPFRVLQAPADHGLDPASKRKIVVKPTLDDVIPFADIAGPNYTTAPTDVTP